MSHSQCNCTGRVYLDLHGLIFETSICYWQDQPGSPQSEGGLLLLLLPLPLLGPTSTRLRFPGGKVKPAEALR